jgi:hypothetical protein
VELRLGGDLPPHLGDETNQGKSASLFVLDLVLVLELVLELVWVLDLVLDLVWVLVCFVLFWF